MSLYRELDEDDFLPRVRENYEGEEIEKSSMYEYWEDYNREEESIKQNEK